ncbi:MAG: hypothetical protein RR051_07325 [Clostridiales bacterium]
MSHCPRDEDCSPSDEDRRPSDEDCQPTHRDFFNPWAAGHYKKCGLAGNDGWSEAFPQQSRGMARLPEGWNRKNGGLAGVGVGLSGVELSGVELLGVELLGVAGS